MRKKRYVVEISRTHRQILVVRAKDATEAAEAARLAASEGGVYTAEWVVDSVVPHEKEPAYSVDFSEPWNPHERKRYTRNKRA